MGGLEFWFDFRLNIGYLSTKYVVIIKKKKRRAQVETLDMGTRGNYRIRYLDYAITKSMHAM